MALLPNSQIPSNKETLNKKSQDPLSLSLSLFSEHPNNLHITKQQKPTSGNSKKSTLFPAVYS